MAFFHKKSDSSSNPVPESSASEATAPVAPVSPSGGATPSVEAPKESNFLNPEGKTVSTDDIFQGLGDSFFSEMAISPEKKAKKKEPLEIAATILDAAVKIGFVAIVLAGTDSAIRNLEVPGFLENLPVCDYLSWGIEGYENTECKTLPAIVAEKEAEKKQTEDTIVSNLLIYVPKKLESTDVLGSPEIQFIKERTGNSRMPLSKMIDAFMEIVSKSDYQGEDIECSGFKLTEKGNMEVSCEFYGDSLSSTSSESKTSRMAALKFFQALETSDFRLLNTPKSLNMSAYNGSDAGIRSIFSTVTKISMNLRYVPANNRP